VIWFFLMLINLIYSIRDEPYIAKSRTCSVSREISHATRARIIELGSKGKGAELQYFVMGS
jgi:hypothetical protein